MIAWATLMLAAAVQGQNVPDRIDIDHAEPGRFDRDALTDAELARQRGGFRLPNGIDVAMTVQTQSAVDGLVVLKTVFRADQGQPALTVLAPARGNRSQHPCPRPRRLRPPTVDRTSPMTAATASRSAPVAADRQ